ncbi:MULTISPECIES: TetR/AcrR family transcriptional regulator [Pseudocitrobacter]|uniref:TetR/AcrR family transcriptional regulator n=1 Tax=Pseudocitrobacter vendiensis TaxID=2488306 RepID=A0ABM9FDD8_9ENTR|nr:MULTISPECIES: TetR/AcrR family transcriptional regulator [Pseudocitrobacter]KAA1048576.1 TetR/AcrR family transcriptional regulator [Pseudocitrobacter sp. 73]CAH6661225.1 TetR/AcrR family transcriptional regulator [Pseudocitrobacter vendiensis]
MTTYDKLIQLADTCIQRDGFHGFSFSDLAEGVGIRKASIHHHFPTKIDLGIAYCEYKNALFMQLNEHLQTIPAGKQRLTGYLEAFSNCAKQGEMCGIYAMLSDSHTFPPELQQAVGRLVQTELDILEALLLSGVKCGDLTLNRLSAQEQAIIVSTTLKGALMLNRLPPHDAYRKTSAALLKTLSAGSE